jgi:serine protease Do
MTPSRLLAPLFLILLAALPARAQSVAELTRTNPTFLHAFRDVAAGPSASTVRVRCDGKDTALGLVVERGGWVLTKANDLKGDVECVLKDGQVFAARLVGVHQAHDLALLKIAADLTPAALKDSKDVAVGSWVACVGPGEDPVAVGVVSVATRHVKLRLPPPSDVARAGYLGVSLEAGDGGVRITQVMPNTAARQAGVMEGDLVVGLSGTTVADPDQFIQQMLKYRPGDEVTLSIRRGDEELELKATLRPRPAGSNRADIQNRMGSALSSRRTGYPTILQHDSVVKPADCGGPLVDLDGKVIGLNICRAGRVESWAIPTEIIKTVLPELKSGRLAPPVDASRLAPDVDALLSAIARRLAVMPDVARAKWNARRPILDAPREAEVLDRLAAKAQKLGLDPADARRLFAAQMAAARMLQEQLFAEWKSAAIDRFDDALDLKEALRPRVDRASDDLLAAYAKLRPHLDTAGCRALVRDRGQKLLGDVSDAVRERALGPIIQ